MALLLLGIPNDEEDDELMAMSGNEAAVALCQSCNMPRTTYLLHAVEISLWGIVTWEFSYDTPGMV